MLDQFNVWRVKMTGLQLLNTALASVLVLGASLAGQSRSIAAEAHAGERGSGHLEAQGRVVSASLGVIPPEKWGSRGMPFELFAASADSVFWCGPCRPNPYSWLTTSVVCRDTLDFRVEVIEASGKRVDVLDFGRVPPAEYRFLLGDLGGLPEGVITLRFVYGDAVIWDGKVMHMSQE